MNDARWPQYLTASERARVAKIDAQLSKLEGQIGPLRAERKAIANRAAQRARHAASKAAQPDAT